MGILDTVIQKAAPMLNRSPQEINQAIAKAKKITAGMTNSLDGAKEVLQKEGIPSDFIDKVANIAKPFAGFVGMNKNDVDNYASQLKGNNNSRQNSSTFDRNKYKKI